MNPLDISTKIINDSEISVARNSTEAEKSNVRFEEVLSNQVNPKKMEDPSKETEFPSQAEQKDDHSLSDSRNNGAEILIGMSAVHAPPSGLLKTFAPSEHAIDETTLAIETENKGVDRGAKQSKNLKIAPTDLLKHTDENTNLAEKKEPFFSGTGLSSLEKMVRVTNDKRSDSSAGSVTSTPAESSAIAKTALMNGGEIEALPPLLTSLGSSSSAAIPTPVQIGIAEHIRSNEWGAQMAQQIKRLALEKIDLAVIEVTPKELGPIVVEIAFVQSEAAIHFSAQHQETQDILSQHANHLKESFSQAGLQLQSITTGSFSDDRAFSFSQQNPNEKKYTSADKKNAKQIDQIEIEKLAIHTVNLPYLSGNSRVDLFA
jgi:flagellar hook-length control protein FliK